MDTSVILMFVIFILLGGFSIIAAIFDLKWFFSTQGAATFIHYFGYKGARIFYFFLGALLIASGCIGFVVYNPFNL
jgi:hypothetical protein